MNLHLLPTRIAGAAENMAVDFLLLQRYPQADVPRFRHYGWRGPAFTFGYSQKIAFVRSALPPGETFDLCRRATGGGVVDHRDDWTYALVIPRGHPLEDVRATQSYREVHECIATALQRQGVPAVAKKTTEPAETTGPEGVCFQRAELYDVVHTGTGEKIAGAAQKRNKRGLLFQGSLWRPAVEADRPGGAAGAFDWDRFYDDFAELLGKLLGGGATNVPWPELNEDEVSGLIEQYSAPEWIEAR